MSESDRTLLPEILPDPSAASPDGNPRERTRARLQTLLARASAAGAGVVMTGCTGFGVVDPLPMDSGFIEGCFEQDGVAGLARLTTDSNIEVVLNPEDPSNFDFVSVTLVSGATEVSRTLNADEAVLVLTPASADGEVLLEIVLRCEQDMADGAPLQVRLVASGLTTEWSVVNGSSAQ
ncbi:MAG: hypothetical protein EP330_06860 [Deltaproteobacteria bacterium]|nr:MAG: hypothetical protein EP330_06860 [Deltaproteobacteria bacterium]